MRLRVPSLSTVAAQRNGARRPAIHNATQPTLWATEDPFLGAFIFGSADSDAAAGRYPSPMAVDVRTEITISRPVDVASAYAARPDNAPDWYVNIKSVEWQTPPPLQIGTRMEFVAHFLGRRLAYTYEVVEWERGRRLVVRTADGPFPMETTYEWFAAG
jgi:hypothetical protein